MAGLGQEADSPEPASLRRGLAERFTLLQSARGRCDNDVLLIGRPSMRGGRPLRAKTPDGDQWEPCHSVQGWHGFATCGEAGTNPAVQNSLDGTGETGCTNDLPIEPER